MENSFCYLGSFANKDEGKAYYMGLKQKIEGLEKLVRETFSEANPQKEFVSQHTDLGGTSELYAPVKIYYDDINYNLGYDLKSYNPTGCIRQSDIFWQKYYDWLSTEYGEDRINKQLAITEDATKERHRQKAELDKVTEAAKTVVDLYSLIPTKGGITKNAFQAHLETMIREIQGLKRFPDLNVNTMTMYEHQIKVSNIDMGKIVEFVNKNRLVPVKYDPTPEGMKLASSSGKARMGKFSKNSIEQTFLIANFDGDVQHMPLIRNEKSAPTLNEIAPGVFVFGDYEQPHNTEQSSTDI